MATFTGTYWIYMFKSDKDSQVEDVEQLVQVCDKLMYQNNTFFSKHFKPYIEKSSG